MSPMRAVDRVMDWVYRPWLTRATLACLAGQSVIQAARLVAMLAPADAVAEYVHTCRDGERALRRWHIGIAAGGGFMPTIFLYAGRWVGMDGQLILWSELAWLTLWLWVGAGWLQATVDEQRAHLFADALTAMVGRTEAPTQAQLNAAREKLGISVEWGDLPADETPAARDHP